MEIEKSFEQRVPDRPQEETALPASKENPPERETQRLILAGIAAGPGRGEGSVRVIRSEKEYASFQDGEVLVTRTTDPSMTLLMSRAAAVVCDLGGITSHAAIVSREMGLPCVVATKTATTTLRTGEHVVVDGAKGEIYTIL